MKESLAMKQRDNINVKQRKTTCFMAMSRIKFCKISDLFRRII